MPQFIPHDYQQVVKDFLVNRTHAGLFLDMGYGKTAITLDTFNTVMPQGHILVVAPLNIVRSTWIDEIEKWGFNVRTQSLVVNDKGRQLTKEERLEIFARIPSEPPTMYFINQEMLTQPSNPLSMVVPGDSPLAGQLDEHPDRMLTLVRRLQQIGKEELFDRFFGEYDHAGQKRPTKKAANDAYKLLREQGLVKNDRVPCPECDGRGGTCCQFGLVDQMPIVQHNGRAARLWPFATVVVDESQGFKNPSSSRFKALASVRPAITRLIEMSGTPTPQGLLDLWSQIYLLDQGEALGKTMSAYKERWFYPDRYVDNRPVSWVPKPGAEKEIYAAISHLVMSVENISLKLPDVTVNDVYVHLDSDEMEAYKEFKKESVLELVDSDGGQVSITAANAAVLSTKLTQFASGTIYTDPVAKKFQVMHDRKIEHLDYILRNTASPVIVAYRFISDKVRLMADLKKLGHDVHLFDGSRDMVRDWNAGRYPVMLLQPASAGHGLNLQDGGHTLVWYTLPFSLEHYLQTNARLHRQGQKNPVVIHRLLTKGTYDERLPLMLAKKKVTQDDLIQAVTMEIGDLDNPWLTETALDAEHDYGFDPYELL